MKGEIIALLLCFHFPLRRSSELIILFCFKHSQTPDSLITRSREIFSSSIQHRDSLIWWCNWFKNASNWSKRFFGSKARVLLSRMNRSQTNKESIFSIIWQFFFLVAIGKDALVVHLGRFLSQVFFSLFWSSLHLYPYSIRILFKKDFFYWSFLIPLVDDYLIIFLGIFLLASEVSCCSIFFLWLIWLKWICVSYCSFHFQTFFLWIIFFFFLVWFFWHRK